ncbi:extensin [Erythrobacter sp. YT30]|nr:extensin [Erythrobacter sp. YT30]
MSRSQRKRTRRTKKAGSRLVRSILLLTIGAIGGFAGWNWLEANPQHNPWAPLDLNDPVGMATVTKLVALRDNVPECRAVLDRSGIEYSALEPVGEGPCARPDRTQLTDIPLAPNTPAVTCPVAAALEMWRRKAVEPAAREILGSELVRMEHMGAYNCRRMRGAGSGSGWSQHATANAIDISAFILADGRRISLLKGWDGSDEEAQFLRRIRDEACDVYATVLSPDFNAAHADHFHFDQSTRWTGVCR